MWRVGLRAPAPEDHGSVNQWLPEALGAVSGRGSQTTTTALDETLKSLRAEQELRLITIDEREPVGVLLTSSLGPYLKTIDALAIAAGRRNLGLGAEAIYCLEEAERDTSFVAGVPLQNGLAIYFWLRIGYAPIFPKPVAPSLGEGRIWMSRDGNAAPPSA